MAKTWYPVIDYISCTECGSCVAKCPHGVYNTEKAPTPVVKNPEACVDHCHGCGNRCPVGAITYVGENTGWTPPKGKPVDEAANCTCDSNRVSEKTVLVDYLYLDLKTCERCIGTDNVLDGIMQVLTPTLQIAGFTVEYRKLEMSTAEIAKRYTFVSSPTIRVNGRDIYSSVKENDCGCCSDISGSDVDCRVFEHEGQTYEIPPQELLAEAILRVIFSEAEDATSPEAYTLPENLKLFYEGKQQKKCSCGGKC